MSTRRNASYPPRPSALLLLLGWLLLCHIPGVAQAADVRLRWPTPEPADTLTRPIVIWVEDARPRAQREAVGVGSKPPGPDAPAGARPTRQTWSLSSSASFERSLGSAVDAALRAKGVWAGRTEVLEGAPRLTVQIRRFWCEDPGTAGQACVAEARLRMGMALLPDVAVQVGPDAPEPFDALAASFVARLTEAVATLEWQQPDGFRLRKRSFVHSVEHGWGEVTAGSEDSLCVWADGRARPLPRAAVDETVRLGMPEEGSVGWLGGGSTEEQPRAVLAPFANALFSLRPDTLSLHRLSPGASWTTHAPLALRGAPCAESVDAAHDESWGDGPFAGLMNPKADESWDFESGGQRSRALGRGVLAARIEVQPRADKKVVVVLIQLDPRWGEVDVVLRYNPPGASWLNERLVHVGGGRFQARIAIARKGSTYLHCSVRAPGMYPTPALATASEAFLLR